MPEFLYNNKLYYNPVEYALSKIGGTWKMPILWRIKEGPKRYTEIKKSIKKISDKMLSSQLKELEEAGMITKKIYPEIPPRTEYKITPKGKEAVKIIITLRNYGLKLMKEDGITPE